MRQHRSKSLARSLALVMLLLFVAAPFGCGDSPGGTSDGDGNGDGNGSGSVISMMYKVPRDALAFDFTDVAAVRADGDLGELYDAYQDDIESECDLLGISPDDVDREGVHLGATGSVQILEGRFDLDGVRNELKDNGYEKGEYKRIETWDSSTADDEMKAVALTSKGCIILASSIDRVTDCIDAINGDEDSLGDDEGFSAVVGRLPAGLVVHVYTTAGYEGCEAYGLSVTKNDLNSRRLTQVFLFVNEDAAGSRRNDIERDFREYYEQESLEVTLDGRYVVLSVVSNTDTLPV